MPVRELALQQARRVQILGQAGLGFLTFARWRLSGGRRPPDPRAAEMWVPAHSLLGRRGLLGATTLEERAFCEWYARSAYRGTGAIVDLGTWLGSTTVPLARGVAGRSRVASRTRVQAYDRFVWEDWMTEYLRGSGVDLGYSPGDDFRPALERALGSHLGIVDVHTADLRSERWTGGAIDLIVIDAMKSWDLARNILREFLTDVAVGGVLFHQDYAHYYTPWIHLIGYRLRDHLELYHDVPHSAGVAFSVRRALTEVDAVELAAPESYGDEEVSAAFRYSRGLVHPDKHASITAAEAMFYVHAGDLERGAAILYRERQLGLPGDQATVDRLIREARADAASGAAAE